MPASNSQFSELSRLNLKSEQAPGFTADKIRNRVAVAQIALVAIAVKCNNGGLIRIIRSEMLTNVFLFASPNTKTLVFLKFADQ